ncbi:DUF1127 domain-containing protein [Vibrio sp. DW001]|uniref:DUF1127 domain-containing protein n=1 Tax=Vibrio sp. DW001 TaxID=2912315 RepID=UPI0023AEB610|nr:DUF1127 domain-containing protein [Vibrio sp. DW001]WED27779.1 DUF1127 domain-containing protein [Vibrio sp. DW001]
MTIHTNSSLNYNRLSAQVSLKNFFTLIKKWHHNACSRQALNELSEHQLSDIGLDKLQAEKEVQKHFWQ